MSSNIRAEKKQSSSSSPVTSLPEEVVVDILARVPRRDYPRVSLVSKYFRSLVSSSEIYARRSSLGCTEHFLYVFLFDWDDRVNRLYTFRWKGNGNSSRLVLIPGLPDMPRDGSFVAVGSRIYVLSGRMTSSAFFIDCASSHTVQHLPRMPFPMSDIVADVIGGRIYVFGYHGTDQKYSHAMLVFNTETQMWEDGMTKPGDVYAYRSLVVMAGKMYMTEFQNSYVYDPKESKWETDEKLSSKFWDHKACVVDDVLYFYDWSDKELRGYDLEHKCWGVVNGLDDFLAEMRRVGCYLTRTGSYAGKLVLFSHRYEINGEICCAEILLERRNGGQIWGKVDQWCDHGLIAGDFSITKSLDVVL
ncbi:F-box/kelch-repeat protein [Raphanus sativus]|uniref:F-box/kelch-repeat protein At4g38940-like n=1 Tax=Raphanus sativus TaxID=3726 RepID=A0A6J0KA13_RAPSA|nr:F-box/kelch-repeat protein At4g38940-like [Raphanus sativus]KAJ4884186.1 F-box/kelch-repeat protein [Raphanus sativus]